MTCMSIGREVSTEEKRYDCEGFEQPNFSEYLTILLK